MNDILQDKRVSYPWLNNLTDYEKDCLRSILNEAYLQGRSDSDKEAILEIRRNCYTIN